MNSGEPHKRENPSNNLIKRDKWDIVEIKKQNVVM